MDHTQLDNHGLHHFALLGDDKGVLCALKRGADVNALDHVGRTVVMCVVAGANWRDMDASDALFMTPSRLNALQILLRRPEISLLTLNLPHTSMHGVIPLGMAAWLNQPKAVRKLLEDSAECVSVDAMDAHGVTALMYAARDGSLEVVQWLLSHGARPDFRDHNHRTALQFALAHPRVLWLCEAVLRRHRWRESKSADQTRISPSSDVLVEFAHSSLPLIENLEPPPLSIFTQEAISRLTNAVIALVNSSDVSFLHSLLFAPSIPVSSPPTLYPMSVPILVNTPDSHGWSPIHHCVAVPFPLIQVLDTLYCAGADVSLFTVREHQTPLHILARSAQHPDSSNSLATFVIHLVRDLRAPLLARDKEDETCIHIAAEHGKSLDLLLLLLEYDVTHTVRHMKNSRGLMPKEVCKPEFLSAFLDQSLSRCPTFSCRRSTDSFSSIATTGSLQTSTYPADHFNVGVSIYGLLDNLHATSPSLKPPPTPVHIGHLLGDARGQYNAIVAHFRARIEDATRVLREVEQKAAIIDSLRNMTVSAARGRLLAQELTPLQPRRCHRDSEDSQFTLTSGVSHPSSPPLTHSPPSHATTSWHELQAHALSNPYEVVSQTKFTSKLQRLLKLKRKSEGKIHELDMSQCKLDKPLGPSKVKSWIKRIVVPKRLEVVLDVEDKHCNVGREVKSLGHTFASAKRLETKDVSVFTALRTSLVVLENAHHDLKSINDRLAVAAQFIESANHSISRANRIFRRAVKKRQTMITNLTTKTKRPENFGLLTADHVECMVTDRASLNSISTIYSTTSSVGATLTENSDEDTRNLRRLLLRKIESQISGAWDEVDKVALWLQIVKEAIRGVKRRAYLDYP